MQDSFADITDNVFYKILLVSDLELAAKTSWVAKQASFDAQSSADENIGRLKDLQTFKDYVRHQRLQMGAKLADLSQPDGFRNNLANVADVMRGMQAIYGVLSDGLSNAVAAAKALPATTGAGLEKYTYYADRMNKETLGTSSDLASGLLHLEQVKNLAGMMQAEAAQDMFLALLGKEKEVPADAPFLNVALDKPMTASRVIRLKRSPAFS